MMSDVFCKIASGELQKEFLYRDDEVMVFHDIHPQAPIHFLVMPVRHVDSLEDADDALMGKLLRTAHTMAQKLGLADSGYRVIINHGEDGGKLVPHLHIHVLGGKKLGPKIVRDEK